MTRQDLAMLLGRVELGGLAVDSELPDIMRKVAMLSDTEFLALCEICTSDTTCMDNVATLNALCHLRDLGHYAGFVAREGAQ